MSCRLLVIAFGFLSVPLVAFAQDAVVNFGVNPTGPLGPPPCSQGPAGTPPGPAIGGPADPCSYKLHNINHDTDVTITKGGQVRFDVGGGGHGIAIYEVHKSTTRDDIGEDLCLGFDRAATPDAGAGQPCNLSATNANADHVVSDGKGDVILVSGVNPPNAQMDYEPGRLASHSAIANATFFTYRFLKTGRYLVTCKNRTHFHNDWMFTFVNVVGN